MARIIVSETEVEDVLRQAAVIAVLGAHPAPERPAFYVPAYLHSAGYRIIPVNARVAGALLFNEHVRGRLTEIGEQVDIVDVFRRAEDLPGHLDDILAMAPRPGVVWMQLGIENLEVAARLVAEGIDVVQNRCTLADHRRLGIPPRAAARSLGS